MFHARFNPRRSLPLYQQCLNRCYTSFTHFCQFSSLKNRLSSKGISFSGAFFSGSISAVLFVLSKSLTKPVIGRRFGCFHRYREHTLGGRNPANHLGCKQPCIPSTTYDNAQFFLETPENYQQHLHQL